jgi:hypothetical protein
MEIKIKRELFNSNSTIGSMLINGEFFGYTLEDKDRGLKDTMTLLEIKTRKVFGQTAIPYGRYEVILNYSNRFKKIMPLLLNVKGFEGVRIHGGNTDKNTLGCPLLGLKKNANGIYDCATINNKLIELIKAEAQKGNSKIYVEITK